MWVKVTDETRARDDGWRVSSGRLWRRAEERSRLVTFFCIFFIFVTKIITLYISVKREFVHLKPFQNRLVQCPFGAHAHLAPESAAVRVLQSCSSGRVRCVPFCLDDSIMNNVSSHAQKWVLCSKLRLTSLIQALWVELYCIETVIWLALFEDHFNP